MLKKNKTVLGVRDEPVSRRAALLAAASGAFILGVLWYTALTGSGPAPRTATATGPSAPPPVVVSAPN